MSRSWLSLLPLLAAAACGGGETPSKDANKGPTPAAFAEQRDMLVIASLSDIGNLIAPTQTSAADSDILANIMTPLIDMEFDCSLKKTPGIATDWSWSEDGKILSLTLDDQYSWADGKPVTAEDIKFALELIGDEKVASARKSYVERMVPGKRPLIVDPTHIEFHFTEAYDRDTQVAHATAMGAVPRHLLGDADRATLRGHEQARNPTPNGPWKLAKYEPNQRIVLEPNENFTGPEEQIPKLKRVVFRILPEYSTRLLELQAGKVDLMDNLLVADVDKLREENPNLRIVRRGWRSSDYVGWNLSNPLFQDVRVRKALAMAVDIDDLIANLETSKTGEAFARKSIGTITPALCNYHNDDIKPLDFDKEAATKLLAEAGWTDSNGDGFLDKDGQKFSFTLTTNAGNKRRSDMQVRLQAAWKQLGIEVNLEKVETNQFFDDLRARNSEAFIAGWSAALFLDPTNVWHCDEPDKKHEFNFTGYCNPKVDELIERGLKTPDPAESAEIWKEMQALIYEDQPYLFVWWRDEIVAVDDRFEGTKIDVLSRINDLNEWYVPEDKVKYDI